MNNNEILLIKPVYMNLKILIDLSYISTFDKLRESVAMYAVRVISEWNNIGMVHFCVLVHENMKDIIVEKFPNFSMEIYPVDNSIISKIPYLRGLYRIVKWRRVISRLEFDVIYMPFCWSGNSLKVKGKKVITIHDLRPMRVAERFLSDTWWFKVLGLKKVYLEIVLPDLTKNSIGIQCERQWLEICRCLKQELAEEDNNIVVSNLVNIFRKLKGDEILVSDVGNHEFWVSRGYELAQISNRILYSKTFGTLGNAVGKAIGAYYREKKRVVCFIGDAGQEEEVKRIEAEIAELSKVEAEWRTIAKEKFSAYVGLQPAVDEKSIDYLSRLRKEYKSLEEISCLIRSFYLHLPL